MRMFQSNAISCSLSQLPAGEGDLLKATVLSNGHVSPWHLARPLPRALLDWGWHGHSWPGDPVLPFTKQGTLALPFIQINSNNTVLKE